MNCSGRITAFSGIIASAKKRGEAKVVQTGTIRARFLSRENQQESTPGPGKIDLHIRGLFAFLLPDWPTPVPGKPPAGPPLRAIVRGAFQPISGNPGNILANSPHETNPGPICCPPRGAGNRWRGNGARIERIWAWGR